MIRRVLKNLARPGGPGAGGEPQLETDGWALLPAVLDRGRGRGPREPRSTTSSPPTEPERSRSDRAEFRYEMLNRSAACQAAIGHPRILEVVEPLLGEDCHVIANTAWRNPPEFKGGPWHCDAGPHVPRPEGVPWDDRIPYPVFAVAAHILLRTAPTPTGRPRSFPAATAPVDVGTV